VATQNGRAIGIGQWTLIYDMFSQGPRHFAVPLSSSRNCRISIESDNVEQMNPAASKTHILISDSAQK
jgi:hypothetical protein